MGTYYIMWIWKERDIRNYLFVVNVLSFQYPISNKYEIKDIIQERNCQLLLCSPSQSNLIIDRVLSKRIKVKRSLTKIIVQYVRKSNDKKGTMYWICRIKTLTGSDRKIQSVFSLIYNILIKVQSDSSTLN